MTLSLLNTITVAGAYADALNTAYGRDRAVKAREDKPAKTRTRRTRMLLERGDSPRSGQPGWRNSYTEGTIEDRVWKPINGGKLRDGKRWTGALLKAAHGRGNLEF